MAGFGGRVFRVREAAAPAAPSAGTSAPVAAIVFAFWLLSGDRLRGFRGFSASYRFGLRSDGRIFRARTDRRTMFPLTARLIPT